MERGEPMTEERRLELEEKLNMAEASGDEAKISAVKKTMEQEYRLCTSHTADRLKRVEATVNAIKDGLIPADMFGKLEDGLTKLSTNFHELKSEVESWKNRVKGAKLLWTILGYIAAAGGSGYIVKLLLASSKTVASSGAVP
jgi:hypothetical protein